MNFIKKKSINSIPIEKLSLFSVEYSMFRVFIIIIQVIRHIINLKNVLLAFSLSSIILIRNIKFKSIFLSIKKNKNIEMIK